MNQLDQVDQKLVNALKGARENLAVCLDCARTIGCEKTAQFENLAGLLTDDRMLYDAGELTTAVDALRAQPWDRERLTAHAGADFAAKACDAEAALLQNLALALKVRSFLHNMLRSMLQTTEGQGVHF